MTNQERFIEQLRRQLNFIRASCESFDRGEFVEGMRISVHLRTLFHDTRNSTSLLSHLNSKQIKILSTVKPIDGCQYADPMIGFSNAGARQGLMPNCYLDFMRFEYYDLPVEKWWNQLIRKIGDNSLSRRNMVLTLANQDGGAHVDSEVDINYQYFNSHSKIIHIMSDGTEVAGFNETSLIIMRQIGFEVLNSRELMDIACFTIDQR